MGFFGGVLLEELSAVVFSPLNSTFAVKNLQPCFSKRPFPSGTEDTLAFGHTGLVFSFLKVFAGLFCKSVYFRFD